MPTAIYPKLTLQTVSRVWDRGEHNAFTDLCRFNGRFWLVFREGAAHVSADGIIILLASDDGDSWQLIAELQQPGIDLRDPKIVVTPDHQLLITCAGVARNEHGGLHQSLLYFSPDGYQWSVPQAVGTLGHWIWRTRFFDGAGYGVAYVPHLESTVLYKLAADEYLPWLDPFFSKASHGLGYPNEHDLFAIGPGRMGCLLRRDADTATAQLGIADAPYLDWCWHDLGVRVGGPVVAAVTLAGAEPQWLCAVRLYNPVRTALCWLDVESKTLQEVISLPSGGDTSYAGLVQCGQKILCSYYSSHEEKTAIYLAELSIG